MTDFHAGDPIWAIQFFSVLLVLEGGQGFSGLQLPSLDLLDLAGQLCVSVVVPQIQVWLDLAVEVNELLLVGGEVLLGLEHVCCGSPDLVGLCM